MKIDKSQVEHVAQLARLHFEEEELKMFVNQLNTILDYFDKLQDLDTTAIEPTSHVVATHNALRDDEVKSFDANDLLLENAPSEENKCYKVPKVIE